MEACKYAGLGRSKIDKLIGQGLIEARKEDGGINAPVYIDLDSIDAFFTNLRKARGAKKRDPEQHPS
jgi:hypothetical protein